MPKFRPGEGLVGGWDSGSMCRFFVLIGPKAFRIRNSQLQFYCGKTLKVDMQREIAVSGFSSSAIGCPGTRMRLGREVQGLR